MKNSKSIMAVIIGVIAIILIFVWYDWKLFIILMLFVWGNNIQLSNKS